MEQRVDFPVFDADNHLYETEDSLTRHLPATHRNLIRFVELGGRKKLVVRDRLTEFIPNPPSRWSPGPAHTWRSTPATTPRGTRCAS